MKNASETVIIGCNRAQVNELVTTHRVSTNYIRNLSFFNKTLNVRVSNRDVVVFSKKKGTKSLKEITVI